MTLKKLLTSLFFSLLFLSQTSLVGAVDSKWCVKDQSIRTALGCISVTTEFGETSFITIIARIIVSLSGGIALVMMLYGTFIVTTSAGIPDKLNEGKDIITSALSGIIFILLSTFLFNLIGINILGIPGLQ